MNRTRRGEQRICKLAGRRSSARKENLKKSTVHCSSSNSSHGGDQAGRLLLITDHRQQQRQLNASPFIRETPPTPRPLWPQRSLFTPNGSSGGVVVVVYDVLQFCLSVCLPAMLLLLLSTGSSGWFSSSFPLFVPTTNFARLWEFIADNSSSPESLQTRQREREKEKEIVVLFVQSFYFVPCHRRHQKSSFFEVVVDVVFENWLCRRRHRWSFFYFSFSSSAGCAVVGIHNTYTHSFEVSLQLEPAEKTVRLLDMFCLFLSVGNTATNFVVAADKKMRGGGTGANKMDSSGQGGTFQWKVAVQCSAQTKTVLRKTRETVNSNVDGNGIHESAATCALPLFRLVLITMTVHVHRFLLLRCSPCSSAEHCNFCCYFCWTMAQADSLWQICHQKERKKKVAKLKEEEGKESGKVGTSIKQRSLSSPAADAAADQFLCQTNT